ncbi:MAG: UbiA family prenyltransferase [Candidatus Micrarchaeota archaeon]|nr:UbiA family prenyltransferase [Candidatus Micrarchaeota archaeon]MDE1824099.1 UbiA family prenyltransferase [Candidatus Micrarchaeota archaeon]MDE1850037.1 UbiA family prenyltransferase [Candidatus Micrarchaeota archaeon]
MGKIGAILRLTRIEHSVMLVIAVITAETISNGIPALPTLILSLITPIFISMGSFAVNDYFDIDVDKANRKSRPLVTGALKPGDALRITAVCMAIGVGASALINIYCFAIALFFAVVSILYSYRLKEMLVLGNAYIAFSMSIPFIFGAYVVNAQLPAVAATLFLIIFISGFAREVHGSIRDYKGDRLRKANTLPKALGIKASAWIAMLLYLVAISMSVYVYSAYRPFFHNAVYAVMIFVTDMLLFYSGTVFLASKRQRDYDSMRNVSLAAMLVALLAFLISALVNIQVPF